VGDSPEAVIRIWNLSIQDVYIVGSLDGSNTGDRYPHLSIVVEGPAGGYQREVFPGCNFVNPIRREDFLRVPPQESMDPYQHIDSEGFFPNLALERGKLTTPGTYRIVFQYSSNEPDVSQWYGGFAETRHEDPSLVELLTMVPRVDLECSATIIVEERAV
jgi:hypothetical protein